MGRCEWYQYAELSAVRNRNLSKDFQASIDGSGGSMIGFAYLEAYTQPR